MEKPAEAVFEFLFEAVDKGAIVPPGESYKYFNFSEDATHMSFKFMHDKIQQAAYDSIENDEKIRIHYKIGKLLLKTFKYSENDEELFNITNHLNYSLSLITSGAESTKLAKLNLFAGRKAKNSTAYIAASEYYETGIKLLGEKAFQTNYELMFSLYLECAQSKSLSGDFENADKMFDLLIKLSKTKLDIEKMEYQSNF